MAKYLVNAHFIDKATETFVEKGTVFEAEAKRAKEINENLAWYAEEKGIEAILVPEKSKKEAEGT